MSDKKENGRIPQPISRENSLDDLKKRPKISNFLSWVIFDRSFVLISNVSQMQFIHNVFLQFHREDAPNEKEVSNLVNEKDLKLKKIANATKEILEAIGIDTKTRIISDI